MQSYTSVNYEVYNWLNWHSIHVVIVACIFTAFVKASFDFRQQNLLQLKNTRKEMKRLQVGR